MVAALGLFLIFHILFPAEKPVGSPVNETAHQSCIEGSAALVAMRRITAPAAPKSPEAMERAPKVLNTVCQGYPAEYPTPDAA